jgi:poly-gamma-glutamate synthesis protein (capsule biosynthesis protein)
VKAALATALILTAAAAIGPASATGARSEGVPSARAATSVSTITGKVRRRMVGSSWHRGCPVGLADLRLLKVPFTDFNNREKTGYLVVNETAATRIVRAFLRLHRAGYRIRRMRLVDAYGADDHRSMNADNTSAFNCREVAGRPGVWSRHAYGRAIDLNPVENPYVSGSHVSPPKGRPFAKRTPRRRGMISAGGRVVRIFASVGWEWGGSWYGAKDFQHFSASGN